MKMMMMLMITVMMKRMMVMMMVMMTVMMVMVMMVVMMMMRDRRWTARVYRNKHPKQSGLSASDHEEATPLGMNARTRPLGARDRPSTTRHAGGRPPARGAGRRCSKAARRGAGLHMEGRRGAARTGGGAHTRLPEG